MNKKIAKKKASALGNMRNIWKKKKSRNMSQNAYFLCLQGIRMRRSIKEEFRKLIYDQLRRRHTARE